MQMGRRGWLGTRAGERGTTGCAHRVPQTARGRAASVVRWHRVPHCARQSVQADLITRRPGQGRLSQAIEAPSVAHVTTIRPPSRRDLPGDPRRVRAPSGRQRRTSSACEMRPSEIQAIFDSLVSVQSLANWRCQRLRRLLGEASSSRCRSWVWIGVISAWSRSRSWCSCW